MWYNRVRGAETAPIVVLCDAPTVEADRAGLPMTMEQIGLFGRHAGEAGVQQDEVAFVSLCPPVPFEISKSASKRWTHVSEYAGQTLELVKRMQPRLVVTMGEMASRLMLGRAVKITKARGMPVMVDDLVVLPTLSPGFVHRVPEALPPFKADMAMLGKIREADFNLAAISVTATDYQWVFDLDPLFSRIGKVLSVDTETTGLRWHESGTRVLTVQFTPSPGVSWIMPVDEEYCRRWFPQFTDEQRLKLVARIKDVLEDPAIMKLGHNFKFDHHMLRLMGISTRNWAHDTQLMAFCVDENMMRKDLDECIRVWVPEMAGYADEFNRHVDKSRMIDVPPEDVLDEHGEIVQYGMRNYAGGDTDGAYRLARVLQLLMKQDPGQLACYRKIMIPAMLVFANSVERHGMMIDRDALAELETELRAYVSRRYRELVRMVPAAVRRKHLEKGCTFTRHDFVRDILFSPEGFGLTPVLFTKSTKDLSPELWVPATGKDHLTYFVNNRNRQVADLTTGMIQLGAAEKMLSTYVGSEADGSGFHKYMTQLTELGGNQRPAGSIFPSYMLHRTNTGRTASADPNGQNFPKRSPKGGPDWAKKYQGIFQSRPGWKLVNCDLSQIELRLVAWMANEPTMLRIYREGGDIHTMTARDVVMQMSHEQWEAQTPEEIDLNRFKAKAVNFGLVYGMAPPSFSVYAKTDYGIDLSVRECEIISERYFRKYAGLRSWHGRMKGFAHKYKFVKALHGATRHLPSIDSTDRGMVSQAERQAVNAPIQRFGSDLGLIAMIRFTAQADPNLYRLVGFVHDALILECREGYEEEGAAYLRWVMQTPPLGPWFGITPPIPIIADCEIAEGQTLSTLKKRKDIVATKPDWWVDDEDLKIQEFLTR